MLEQREIRADTPVMQPGLFTEATARGALNRWKDGDHVRFVNGLPEKLGGWLDADVTSGSGDAPGGTVTNPVAYVPSSKDVFSLSAATSMTVSLVNSDVEPDTYPDAIVVVSINIHSSSTSGAFVGPTGITIGGLAAAVHWKKGTVGFSTGQTHAVVATVRVPTDNFANTDVVITWPSLVVSGTVVRASANAFYNVDSSSDAFALGVIDGDAVTTVGTLTVPDGGAVFADNIQYTGGDYDATVWSNSPLVAYTMQTPDVLLQSGHYYMTGYRLFSTGLTETLLANPNNDGFRPVIAFVMAPSTSGTPAVAGPSGDFVVGVPRAMLSWFSLDGQEIIAFGTGPKLYLINQDIVYDITPSRRQAGLTNPFAVTNTSTTATVTDAGHGANRFDYVRFSGATAVGGVTISGQYRIETVVGPNSYTITLASAATSTATGGGSVTAVYDIHAGLDYPGFWYGWGTGPWGEGTWGTARDVSTMTRAISLWSLDNWGEDLMASPRGNNVYYWDKTLGYESRAVSISSDLIGDNNGAPVSNQRVLVSGQSRQLVCLGANHNNVADPLYIAVSDNDDFNTFSPTTSNNAFDARLSSGSTILTGIRTRLGILIFTDLSIFLMQPVGGDEVYNIQAISENNSIIGPNAAIEIDGTVYGMGLKKFLAYDGVLQVMECEVYTEVFGDFNYDLADAVYCWHNNVFNEIWWFYPSALATDNDKYVIYNYRERHWSYGNLNRTAGIPRSSYYGVPMAFDTDANLIKHETGYNDGLVAMASRLESYDIQSAEAGSEYISISRAVPDMKALNGTVSLYIMTKRFPGDPVYAERGPYVIQSGTGRLSTRARGKLFSIKLESDAIDDYWRAGFFTYDVQNDGER